MSIELVNLSYKQKNLTSSEKSVLVRLAWHSDPIKHQCWPSIKSISQDTSLDRKTVQQCLLSLCAKELLKTTGEMKGRTKSIPVYQLLISDPKIGIAQNTSDPVFSISDPKIGICKRSQKRDMERLYKKGYGKDVSLIKNLTQEQKQDLSYYMKHPEYKMPDELRNLII